MQQNMNTHNSNHITDVDDQGITHEDMWGEPDQDEDEDGLNETEADEEEITPATGGKARPQRPSRAAKGTAARRGRRTTGEGATGARKARRTSTGSDA